MEMKSIQESGEQVLTFGKLGSGRGFRIDHLGSPEALEGYDVIVVDPKEEYCSFNALTGSTDENTTNQLMKELGVSEEKMGLYVALAGLVNYGEFFKGKDCKLRTMAFLEQKPIEQLNKLFDNEHRNGKLPVFFYECWKKYRSHLDSVNESR